MDIFVRDVGVTQLKWQRECVLLARLPRRSVAGIAKLDICIRMAPVTISVTCVAKNIGCKAKPSAISVR
jgi:hypothetical protein